MNKRIWGFYSRLIGLCIICMPLSAHALSDSNNSELCKSAITQEESASFIPQNVLRAISHVESGRRDPKNKVFSAWPWTVNAEGQGSFFDTKQQAINFVRQLQSRGVKSIDVGCMQINLHHHKSAFQSLEHAFDPMTNVRYAARYLKALYNDSQSWPTAIGNYHSATPEFHDKYKKKVLANLQSLNKKPLPTNLASPVIRPGMTIAEIDAARKAAVMAAWELRKKNQTRANGKQLAEAGTSF